MNDKTTDAASMFAPVWKRKWWILAIALIVAAATYEHYKGQTPTFGASTELYFGESSEQQASGQAKAGLSARSLQNQVGLIESPIILETVRKRLHHEGNLKAARGTAKVKTSNQGAFITIKTTAHSPRAAATLANAISRTYIARERLDYLRNIKSEIAEDREQLLRLELPATSAKGKAAKSASSTTTLQAASLANKINELETDLTTFSGVLQVAPAKAQLTPISASPKRNAIFGFVIGLVLASIAAYALGRLDRRLRSLSEIERIFQTEILVALPTVKAPVKRPDGTRAPAPGLLEPLRRLYTTLQLGHTIDSKRQSGPRVVLFVSADAGDGKSTLIANLARVQSDGGARVAVIDADFRRPALSRLLDIDSSRGLADVLSGAAPLASALQTVPSSAPPVARAEPVVDAAGVSTVVQPLSTGLLSALVSRGEVANPPALLAGDSMRGLLRSLSEEFDYVLIDAPPPLEVSDAMPLLALVDGIVIVARIGHTRHVFAERLAQLLGRTATAPLLGAVANCVPRRDIRRWGFVLVPAGRRKQRGR